MGRRAALRACAGEHAILREIGAHADLEAWFRQKVLEAMGRGRIGRGRQTRRSRLADAFFIALAGGEAEARSCARCLAGAVRADLQEAARDDHNAAASEVRNYLVYSPASLAAPPGRPLAANPTGLHLGVNGLWASLQITVLARKCPARVKNRSTRECQVKHCPLKSLRALMLRDGIILKTMLVGAKKHRRVALIGRLRIVSRCAYGRSERRAPEIVPDSAKKCHSSARATNGPGITSLMAALQWLSRPATYAVYPPCSCGPIHRRANSLH